MRGRGAAAFVSSGLHDYTVVLDADSDWGGPSVSELAQDLSAQFACPVLSVAVHDDDVTYYELWNAGEHRDTYDSTPSFSDPEKRGPPEGGNATELVRLIGREACDEAVVERILRAAHGMGGPNTYLFEHERHAALIAALGLPDNAAGFGYRYLAASISDGRPLSTEFESTGVPYQEPKFEPLNIVVGWE